MRFLRTPTLSRSVVGLLSIAIVLLLVINAATFVMIRRTVEFNSRVEQLQQSRRAARNVLVSVLNAETSQRGFLLAAQPQYLAPFNEARAVLPEQLERLHSLMDVEPDMAVRAALVDQLAEDKMAELERSLALASAGRIGEAMQLVRSGEGKRAMDRLRSEVQAIDEIQETRLQFARRRSEWASTVTVVVNSAAGILILVLAGISGWMVRRYVLEIQAGRDALDRANQGLEDKVRDRTAALTRANEEIQRFAYIVSHDLRAPLVNVMGYTSELDQVGKVLERQVQTIETKSPKLLDAEAVTAVREDVPEAIGFIRASTAKMDRLINAILKLSREGRRNLAPEPLEMTDLVQAIADSVRHQTDAADAAITVERLPWFESDRLSVEQIFGNLIDNAVKYLDPDRPGRIVASGRDTGDGRVEFRLSDNGRGIAPKDHERVFELFRRSGRQDRPGEGLGLAFVRNSVRRLGGDIEIESELGQGSTFVMKFPKRLIAHEAGDRL